MNRESLTDFCNIDCNENECGRVLMLISRDGGMSLTIRPLPLPFTTPHPLLWELNLHVTLSGGI